MVLVAAAASNGGAPHAFERDGEDWDVLLLAGVQGQVDGRVVVHRCLLVLLGAGQVEEEVEQLVNVVSLVLGGQLVVRQLLRARVAARGRLVESHLQIDVFNRVPLEGESAAAKDASAREKRQQRACHRRRPHAHGVEQF